ncbi:translocon-associated protein subunit delta [Anthonomus grandis grandis]|uniref:translocon-associated protein subunit delta n=1 Tax=Anthonomus grandis grandis TaxID=2921223 RepID=UPI0021665C37|nr:translocon-associated protein subunit delta [Anthonomus grandis grandis]
MWRNLLFSSLLVVFLSGLSLACTNPQVTSKSFTTQDATIVTHIAYIADFQVKCSSGDVSNLYAELEDGSIVPVAQVAPDTYQVSWSEENKLARRGEHLIRIFDEEGFGAVRKALRANEPSSSVKESFTVSVNHYGAYNGPWLRSEFVAVLVSLVVTYVAITNKSKIVS